MKPNQLRETEEIPPQFSSIQGETGSREKEKERPEHICWPDYVVPPLFFIFAADIEARGSNTVRGFFQALHFML